MVKKVLRSAEKFSEPFPLSPLPLLPLSKGCARLSLAPDPIAGAVFKLLSCLWPEGRSPEWNPVRGCVGRPDFLGASDRPTFFSRSVENEEGDRPYLLEPFRGP